MVLSNDPLSDALNVLLTHSVAGKGECAIRPASKLIKEVLGLFQKNNYIGKFEFVDDGKSGSFKVQLIGNINECKVIKPRFVVKLSELVKWEQRYIPGKDFGFLILSTPKGVVTNKEARERKTGGRLLAYIY